MFIKASHWSLTWHTCIQSAPSQPISLRFILILSSHLHLGLESGLFPSDFIYLPLPRYFKRICPSLRPCVTFHNKMVFYELLASHSPYNWRTIPIRCL
jgi:hypothetical protein